MSAEDVVGVAIVVVYIVMVLAFMVTMIGWSAADKHHGVWPRGLRWWPVWWRWLGRSTKGLGGRIFYPERQPVKMKALNKARVRLEETQTEFTPEELDRQWREASVGRQIPYWVEGRGWSHRLPPSAHPEMNKHGEWD